MEPEAQQDANAPDEFVAEVKVTDPLGVHARPIMRLTDLASGFQSDIKITNLSFRIDDEYYTADAKSSMQWLLLQAVQGTVLRIHCKGPDATEAGMAIAKLVVEGSGLHYGG